MEGFAPFCLVCCFVVIQLYHNLERISSPFFLKFFCLRLFFPLFACGEFSAETQEEKNH